ncbi:MAG: tetratricopeptide repeat protein, partial [Dehalococcoidia bacterium]
MKDIIEAVKFVWGFLMWIPRRLRLIKQEKKDAEKEVMVWLQRHRESLEEQLTKETDELIKDALEEKLGATIAAQRGYYMRMVEISLQRAGKPAYDDLVANGERVVEPKNRAKLTQAVARLDLLPPPHTADESMGSASAKYALLRYDEALADLNRAIEIRPDYAQALNNRGITYGKLERYDEALADYSRALELRPDYAESLYNRGVTYGKINRYDKALADYNSALELRPDDDKALNNRGVAYGKLGRYNEALADYNCALELRPDDATVLNNRGNTYDELERYDEA